MLASLGVHVYEACIGLWLEKRANIHEKDNDGMRALVYASEGGHETSIGPLSIDYYLIILLTIFSGPLSVINCY